MSKEVHYKIGDRVLGCKGTRVEGLIGTVVALSDIEDKVFVSFIPPLDETIRAKVHIVLNAPNVKSAAVALSLGISVSKKDVIHVNNFLDTIRAKYDKYKVRYGFEYNAKKKAAIEEKIHIIHNSMRELSRSIMTTGYFDHSEYDLKKMLEDD